MSERLQKYLARAGVASRRHAEGLITAGRVTVNNVRVTQLGTKVDPADLVAVDGKLVQPPERSAYFLLYKPAGVVTTMSDPEGRPTVAELLAPLKRRTFPIGRLDYDAEGALLCTDDGALSHQLTHPSFEVQRTYLAKVKGEPDGPTLAKLREGVRLEDGMAKPTSVSLFERAEKNTWLKLTVTEGRPHLIKRLCAAIGHPVLRLFRPTHAGIALARMKPGDIRPLSAQEVEQLHRVASGEEEPKEGTLELPPRRHGRSTSGSGDWARGEAPDRPSIRAQPPAPGGRRGGGLRTSLQAEKGKEGRGTLRRGPFRGKPAGKRKTPAAHRPPRPRSR